MALLQLDTEEYESQIEKLTQEYSEKTGQDYFSDPESEPNLSDNTDELIRILR